jgi:hypothetical protein
MPYGSNGFNPWVWIILVLIVLQWFRVGSNGFDGIGGPGGAISPEGCLVRNGGLFIIAIFLLAACGCFRAPIIPPVSPIRFSAC